MRMFMEVFLGFVYIIIMELEFFYVNDCNWFVFIGLFLEQVLGYGWLFVVYFDDVVRLVQEVCSDDCDLQVVELCYWVVDGSYYWYLVCVVVYYDWNGEFKGWIGISIDIYSFKEMEVVLCESEECLVLVQCVVRIGVFDWDVVSGYISWIFEQEQMFGIEFGSFEENYEGWSFCVYLVDVVVFEKNFCEVVFRGDQELVFVYWIVLLDGFFCYIEG